MVELVTTKNYILYSHKDENSIENKNIEFYLEKKIRNERKKPTEGLLITLHSKHIFWDSWANLVSICDSAQGRHAQIEKSTQKEGF